MAAKRSNFLDDRVMAIAGHYVIRVNVRGQGPTDSAKRKVLY